MGSFSKRKKTPTTELNIFLSENFFGLNLIKSVKNKKLVCWFISATDALLKINHLPPFFIIVNLSHCFPLCPWSAAALNYRPHFADTAMADNQRFSASCLNIPNLTFFLGKTVEKMFVEPASYSSIILYSNIRHHHLEAIIQFVSSRPPIWPTLLRLISLMWVLSSYEKKIVQ